MHSGRYGYEKQTKFDIIVLLNEHTMEIAMTGKNIFYITLMILLAFMNLTLICSSEITFTDTSGETITLPGTAERIVCLNSDAAETMVILGAGDKVVGLTDSTLADTALMKHLPKATSVGNWQTPNIERILALKPDAVISYSSSRPKNADQLKNAGINLIYLDCYKFNTLEHDIQALGTLTGSEGKAERYITFMKKWENQVRSRVGNVSSEKYLRYILRGILIIRHREKIAGLIYSWKLHRGKIWQ